MSFNSKMIVECNEVKLAIKDLSSNKAGGKDCLTAEHLKFCSDKMYILVGLLFSEMLLHGHLPRKSCSILLYSLL